MWGDDPPQRKAVARAETHRWAYWAVLRSSEEAILVKAKCVQEVCSARGRRKLAESRPP